MANPDSFALYRQELIRQRRSAGLTSLSDPDAIERRLFGDSLALLRALEDGGWLASPAIDIGSGAGFPGLPMKIARPELQVTLLEATGKKAAFLQDVVSRLGLTGVTIIYARAEDLARDPAHRAAYRLALARAVAPLPVLLELALPFLALGGVLASPKGSGAQREVRESAAALATLGGQVEAVQKLETAAPGTPPTLVIVRKTAETPDSYPRRPGIPAKRPL